MDQLTIKSIDLPAYNLISVLASNNVIYTADLSSFNDVYCYPKDFDEWKLATAIEISIIGWPCGFDIHLEQIIALSYKDPKAKTA